MNDKDGIIFQENILFQTILQNMYFRQKQDIPSSNVSFSVVQRARNIDKKRVQRTVWKISMGQT